MLLAVVAGLQKAVVAVRFQELLEDFAVEQLQLPCTAGSIAHICFQC
jgi:hypothetical protein